MRIITFVIIIWASTATRIFSVDQNSVAQGHVEAVSRSLPINIGIWLQLTSISSWMPLTKCQSSLVENCIFLKHNVPKPLFPNLYKYVGTVSPPLSVGWSYVIVLMLQSFNLKILCPCIQTKYWSGVILNVVLHLSSSSLLNPSWNIFLSFVDLACTFSLQCFKLLWRPSPVKR